MTSTLRVLVVDDEPAARRVLVSLLSAAAGVRIVDVCSNGNDAIRVLKQEDIDVVFLDIQMPETTGFDVLAAVDEGRWPLVVFVTAYEEHAVRAFEVGAVDYLLKPFDDERFAAVLARIRERATVAGRSELRRELLRLASRLAHLEDLPEPTLSDSNAEDQSLRFAIRTGRRIRFVDVASVQWIEAVNYYARLHTSEGPHLLRETLTRLESRLDPSAFVRVHRSAIVRIQCVQELVAHQSGHYEALLVDGTRVRVSRSRRARVMQVLDTARAEQR